ncbi:4-hydroxy-tetrahydrodipicolinate synthase [Vallitalea pronyensis]|uniref:4-hydroxy-tetrahydrodipicolinate synthase n=1 Tax=Vallitalea pronyensis TaxID=1348613 RepID=A0A8J8MIT5_9FIRM|nr:4-hydroxy-tetrahydrodipicolinate synthase [Vallitalea pronyensis]QUI22028.1 4-hydroxy-tetrahydrodipicolinate synthase [Vallitalea pronyensis]
MAIFTGSGVAIVTPFTKDMQVDYAGLEKLIDFQLDGGTDCIVICGTTGEASTLNDEEHLECIKVAVDRTNKRVPVIAGTGSNDTAHGIELSKKAEQLGVDGLLQVTPYYNKTTQKGLIQHFTSIANSVNVPVVLYNVPSRTGLNINAATAAALSHVDNIVAIKEASGNITHITDLMHKCEGRLDLYSGNDDQIVPLLSLGGKGVISVIANMLPQETHDIVMKYMEGDTKGSLDLQMKLHNLMGALFCEVNPIPVKTAMGYMGLPAGPCRLPLTDMEPQNIQILKKAMQDYGINI